MLPSARWWQGRGLLHLTSSSVLRRANILWHTRMDPQSLFFFSEQKTASVTYSTSAATNADQACSVASVSARTGKDFTKHTLTRWIIKDRKKFGSLHWLVTLYTDLVQFWVKWIWISFWMCQRNKATPSRCSNRSLLCSRNKHAFSVCDAGFVS